MLLSFKRLFTTSVTLTFGLTVQNLVEIIQKQLKTGTTITKKFHLKIKYLFIIV